MGFFTLRCNACGREFQPTTDMGRSSSIQVVVSGSNAQIFLVCPFCYTNEKIYETPLKELKNE